MSVSTAIDSAALRHALGHFATGVTVVTSLDGDGAPVGTTANAVSSVSLDPPLILVCFAKDSLTLGHVAEHGAFAVNVLGHHHEEASSAFARRGAADAWEKVTHRSGHTGVPRVDDAIAVFDCTVEHRIPGGDHEIVIGRVVDVEAAGGTPLLFYRGAYARLESA
ncbi:MAG: flavin reductase family protein [Solirubrobacteraceae bacterium]|nr:flavin reductase family protein [Solirubrobacteraceae bacterium]